MEKSEHKLGIVIAKDSEQNEYTKTVQILTYLDRDPILDFGWPCQYGLYDLMRFYPFDEGMCIDMGGHNHAGIPHVVVSAADMNAMVERAVIWLFLREHFQKPNKSF
jgi:hypothetical protein